MARHRFPAGHPYPATIAPGFLPGPVVWSPYNGFMMDPVEGYGWKAGKRRITMPTARRRGGMRLGLKAADGTSHPAPPALGHPYGLVMMDPVEGCGRKNGAFPAFGACGDYCDYGAPLKFNTWWYSTSRAAKCPAYAAKTEEWEALKAHWKRLKWRDRTREMKNEGKALEKEGKAAWKACKAEKKALKHAEEEFEYDPYIEETYVQETYTDPASGYDPGGYTPPATYPTGGTGNGATVGGIPPILLWGGAAVGGLVVLSLLFR